MRDGKRSGIGEEPGGGGCVLLEATLLATGSLSEPGVTPIGVSARWKGGRRAQKAVLSSGVY